MNNIHEIEEELKDCAPGTEIAIHGYIDSSGNKRDIEATLITPEDYRHMQKEDLSKLDEVKSLDELAEHGEFDMLGQADLAAAKDDIIRRTRGALNQADGERSYRGADYVYVGGSISRLPSKAEEAIYIQRLRLRKGVVDPKPAKGAVPRAKQMLTKKLDLPTRYYVHTLKLAPGKFESVEVLKKIEVPKVPAK